LVKEEVERGTRKRFQTTITNLAGTPTDPSECYVRLEKVGYNYSQPPTQWYTCSKVGTTGVWGADISIPDSLTLGDYLARFYWLISGTPDNDSFEFVLIRKDKPWVNTRGPVVP
jgi:hypothetical protein